MIHSRKPIVSLDFTWTKHRFGASHKIQFLSRHEFHLVNQKSSGQYPWLKGNVALHHAGVFRSGRFPHFLYPWWSRDPSRDPSQGPSILSIRVPTKKVSLFWIAMVLHWSWCGSRDPPLKTTNPWHLRISFAPGIQMNMRSNNVTEHRIDNGKQTPILILARNACQHTVKSSETMGFLLWIIVKMHHFRSIFYPSDVLILYWLEPFAMIPKNVSMNT